MLNVQMLNVKDQLLKSKRTKFASKTNQANYYLLHCESTMVAFTFLLGYFTKIRSVKWLLRLGHSQKGGSVAEWLACWTQAQKGRVQIAVATLSSNSLKQTVHTHCASVHQAAKLVATLLRVAGVSR